MTKEDWYATPANAQRLAELLKDPVMSAALAVLRDEGVPSTDPRMSGVGVEQGAMIHAFLSGFNRFPARLAQLVRPERTTPPAEVPWGHLRKQKTNA